MVIQIVNFQLLDDFPKVYDFFLVFSTWRSDTAKKFQVLARKKALKGAKAAPVSRKSCVRRAVTNAGPTSRV